MFFFFTISMYSIVLTLYVLEPIKANNLVDNTRVFCTFTGDMEMMYRNIKKHFTGQLCHAIVYGEPIVIKDQQIVKSQERNGIFFKCLLQILIHKSNNLFCYRFSSPEKGSKI